MSITIDKLIEKYTPLAHAIVQKFLTTYCLSSKRYEHDLNHEAIVALWEALAAHQRSPAAFVRSYIARSIWRALKHYVDFERSVPHLPSHPRPQRWSVDDPEVEDLLVGPGSPDTDDSLDRGTVLDEGDLELLKLRRAGLKLRQIAAAVGRSKSSVQRRLQELERMMGGKKSQNSPRSLGKTENSGLSDRGRDTVVDRFLADRLQPSPTGDVKLVDLVACIESSLSPAERRAWPRKRIGSAIKSRLDVTKGSDLTYRINGVEFRTVPLGWTEAATAA